MKKLTLITAITINIFLLTINLFSQPCLPEGITFHSQEEIDNFQTNYPNCTEIEGDVTISGDDIDNLNGLDILTAIGGSLVIGDTLNLNIQIFLLSMVMDYSKLQISLVLFFLIIIQMYYFTI